MKCERSLEALLTLPNGELISYKLFVNEKDPMDVLRKTRLGVMLTHQGGHCLHQAPISLPIFRPVFLGISVRFLSFIGLTSSFL